MPPTAPETSPAPASDSPAGQHPLPPPLDDYRRQLLAVVDDFEALVRDLDDAAFHWAPDEHTWSIGQCLDHLNTVDRAYGRRLEHALEAAVARGDGAALGSRRRGPSLAERLLVASMEPPPRLRMPAPRSVVPPSTVDPEAVRASFRSEHQRLLCALEEAHDLDLHAIHIRSPLLALLRLSAATAFGFVAAHDRRHLWQAWALRRRDAFPG